MAITPRTRSRIPDSERLPRFAGIATFCRLPTIDSVPPEHQPVDWALYGVPFDGGVTYRTGARFGPRAVRDASQYVKRYHPELGVDVATTLSMADAGDAPVSPYSCRRTLEKVAAFAQELGDPGHTRLLAVGGDHSIAYANIRATWERLGRPAGGLGLLHFDAHLDTTGDVWDEDWSHASPFRHAIQDGLIDAQRMISIGIRGPMNPPDVLDFSREHGNTIVTCDQWRRGEGEPALRAVLDRIGDGPAYLSFDVDCVDPAYAPGTGTPVCGGFTSAEAFDLLRLCAGVNLAGADVVEVLPDRDPAGITALLAAHVLFEILSLAALRAGGGPA